jgi:hypothetical protein
LTNALEWIGILALAKDDSGIPYILLSRRLPITSTTPSFIGSLTFAFLHPLNLDAMEKVTAFARLAGRVAADRVAADRVAADRVSKAEEEMAKLNPPPQTRRSSRKGGGSGGVGSTRRALSTAQLAEVRRDS